MTSTRALTRLAQTEHRNPEGRTYWFNTGTQQSVWEKPDADLKTPFEKALNQTKWKEYFSGGRKYYYHTETKESKWDMPDELLLLLEKVEKDGPAAPGLPKAITGTPAAGATQGAIVPSEGATPSSSASQPQQNGSNLAVGPHTGGAGALPLNPSSVLPVRPNLPDDPVIPHNGFMTVEEGEKAFTHLLRKAGVDANWSWDQTMRAIITDPLYKALNTLAEKKACWEKYVNGLKQKEQEERDARLSKLRPAIRNMLKGNPNVFHYTTFGTADKLFAQHPIWQQARITEERRLIFDEYVQELKNKEVQEQRAARTRAVAKVVSLFKELNVDVVTRWRDARKRLETSDEWAEDSELASLPTLDILLAFEDYSRVREREYEEQMRRAAVEKTRKERKAREGFRELLAELVDAGKIKARTKWKEVYPSFKEDERYLTILGSPGSNPLELFWDLVDSLDQKLDEKIAVVEEVLKSVKKVERESTPEQGEEPTAVSDEGFVVKPETTQEEFCAVVKENANDAVKAMPKDDIELIFKTLHDAALKKQADEKRRQERKMRHLQDDLRYAMKKLSEPLDISLSYEEVVPLIENLPEYKALDDDEGRRAAFTKYVKRQKEKMRETASEDGSVTSRKRKEPHRDYERDKSRDGHRERDHKDRDSYRERDRDRYEKGSRSSRHHGRYDDYDDHRSSRDHRDKDYDKDYRSRHHRDDDRKRERTSERRGSYRDYDEPPREERRHQEELDPRAEKVCDYVLAQVQPLTSLKRARYDDLPEPEGQPMEVDSRASARAETPEEGEI
ncbi:pre-mRNA-processing protein prp40 [Coprinopsis sp. MPI-PUGE-AT-0042]|nr:pre-mRNA-processing protein prp40 [Coprinopsis sp. MPI-PUGE-AT-0042]